MGTPTSLDPRGGVAVITGAAGGIGAALALQLAARGCHLALVDINAAGLASRSLSGFPSYRKHAPAWTIG